MLLALWVGVGAALGQSPPAEGSGSEPFHDFREQPLEYPGPETDRLIPADLTEIVIGWFGPADSEHPLHGDLWTAASLAVAEANSAGGWGGLPFRLVPRWSENVWSTGVSQVARMAYEEGVWALLGSVDGASTHLAEQVVAKARLPLISAVSTDSSVNLAGVPWMFSVAPGDHLWAPVLAAHLVDTVAGRAFALIAVTDHDSRLATAALLEALDELDRAPSHRLDLAPGTVDLESRLARLNLPVLAALVLVAGPEDGARLLREVRAYGFDGEIFATPSFARRRSLEIAGTAAEGVRIPLLWQSRPEASGHHSFEDLFRQRTGVDPDWAAAYTFDATRLLLEAVGRAGLSRAGIREALVDLSPWEGITGVIEWDPTGQNRRPVIAMATVREGHPRTE